MKRLLLIIMVVGLAQTFAATGFTQDELSEEISSDTSSSEPAAEETSAPDTSSAPVDDYGASEETLYKNEADTLMENRIERAEKKEAFPTEGGQKGSEKLKSITELDKLTPFNDVAVIQKRFLPKSERFEFNPNFGLITNNAFFMTTFLQARLAYAFTEKLALEFIVATFMDQEYKVTEDLKNDANVATKSLLLPEMYYGADVRWSPIYGKMGSFHEGIVPFDMYFSAGGGIMSTNQDTTPFALHAGTGQIFAINKWMAFRWDLSMYFYTSEVASANAASTDKTSNSFTDVQLSVGMSFFFPDATYR